MVGSIPRRHCVRELESAPGDPEKAIGVYGLKNAIGVLRAQAESSIDGRIVSAEHVNGPVEAD